MEKCGTPIMNLRVQITYYQKTKNKQTDATTSIFSREQNLKPCVI